MNSEPNWLNIEEELYPQVYISKVIHIDSSPVGPIDYPVHLLYNTLHREINVTQALAQLITTYFNMANQFKVFMFHEQQQEFKPVGRFPFKQPIILKGLFVQSQFLVVKLELICQTNPPADNKVKTDRTLKAILQKVARWRKINIESQNKITLEESANMLGISRSTLDDYYFQIKLAEKYGFNFHNQLDKPFKNLRKFVKENQEKKNKTPNPLPNILAKYQPK